MRLDRVSREVMAVEIGRIPEEVKKVRRNGVELLVEAELKRIWIALDGAGEGVPATPMQVHERSR